MKMQRMAKFEKVSFEQFLKDLRDAIPEDALNMTDEEIREVYDEIKLPKRATKGSAGYDFFSPLWVVLVPGGSIKIPTGIRAQIDEGWWLEMLPRSGLGTKYRVQLDNTVGVIDSDYYNSDNEGHIMVKLTNDGREGKLAEIETGSGFCQGIFTVFGITRDDDVETERNGGFGSTDQNDTYHQITMDEYMSES